MSDGESQCKRCNQISDELEGGLCPACQNPDDTIAPTPTPDIQDDATIVPTRTRGIKDDATIMPGGVSSSDPDVTQVGDYDLIEEIARGGMGVVYKANHRNLNRVSAVKMILGGRFSSEEERQRFRIEAESAAKLDHPAIVPIFEIGEHEGQAFFAMKYIDGGSLAERISSFTNNPRKAAELMMKVAEGVYHAHQRGVLHRDLKPANVLLDHDGEPFVTDLGLAKSTTGGSDLTHTGAVLGTPSYMPPEQAAGDSLTTAADVYSLGAILYELLAGKPPYQGNSSVNVVMKVIDGPPPPPHKINVNVDRDLELICLKSMSRDPDQRYSSTQEMANDLQAWLDGKTLSVRPPTLRALVGSWFRQNQKLVYAMFALMMGFLVCAPMVLGFFSDRVGDIYEMFPNTPRPLVFSFKLPRWMALISTVILFFVLWPSIGFLNAVISKPATLKKSIWSGVSIAAVLSLIFYCLAGWMVFLQSARNSVNNDVQKLAHVAWPTEEVDRAKAIKEANQMYDGLETIPDEAKANAVWQRLLAELYASVPVAFLILGVTAFLFSIPIVFGTAIGYLLLDRGIPTWLFVIRYLIAWWATILLVIAVILLAATFLSTNVSTVSINGWSPRDNVSVVGLAIAVLAFVAWLALRTWRKAKPKEVQTALE